MADHITAHFATPAPDPDWSDRSAVIEYIVDSERLFGGSYPVDEDRLRRIAARVYDRTTDMAASMTNHWIIDGGTPIRPRLGEITAPPWCCTAPKTRSSHTATLRRWSPRSPAPGSYR